MTFAYRVPIYVRMDWYEIGMPLPIGCWIGWLECPLLSGYRGMLGWRGIGWWSLDCRICNELVDWIMIGIWLVDRLCVELVNWSRIDMSLSDFYRIGFGRLAWDCSGIGGGLVLKYLVLHWIGVLVMIEIGLAIDWYMIGMDRYQIGDGSARICKRLAMDWHRLVQRLVL